MKKQIISLSLLVISITVSAQLKNTEADTIRIGTIEDVNIRKTGNPNKATPMSTKSNLTVMETPQPIAIITHAIIEQQQAKQLSDVLQNVNGMYITSSRGNSQDSFGGRGFALGNDNIFKNGSRVNSGVFPEVSGLERVEVLKGANAMLYGNTAAGGVINMITKKPRFDFGGSVGLNAGSWNSYKPTVDIYGPLTKNIAFRVNGAYEYAESFRDVVQSEKYYFNPSFLFNLSPKSQLIVEADYLKNDFTPDFGIGGITANDGSYSLNTNTDRSTFFGTKWQYQNIEQVSTNVTFNHQINDKWSLNATTSYQNYTKDYFSTERVAWTYAKTSPTRLSWTVPYIKTNGEQNYGSAQVNLNGEFNTGSIGHKVLIGADADYGQTDAYTYTLTNSPSKVVYLDDPSTWDSTDLAMPDSKLNINNRTRTRRVGVYAQDFISLTKEFKVIAGLRWSYIENMATIKTDFNTGIKTLTPNSSSSDQALSPKLGLVYMPNDNLSVFATYTNSFSTNTGRDINENALNPTTIDQYEVGMKKNLFGNALSFNVSLYQILYNKYYGTAQFDRNGVANNDTTIKEYIGKMSSRGFEVDITGNPTKYLSIIGGFSYNHSVYKDTPDLPSSYVEDQRLVRTPATTANLSVFYKFSEKLQGLKVGAGVYYVGSRFAGWNDTKATLASRNNVTRMFEVDPFTTASFSVGYDWKKFSIQGKLNNIFDTKSYNVHENYSVNPITPRNFYFTLTYKL
ncbi:Catecholate siderophore receptor Fiu precursor [Chryseobacterium sp. MOF25P]|uniref:TonB-dependent siderophore receptor n=1 Tax=unclassified Chryseobacterium TaxID=2593645 RepID=UPI000805E0EB|nr:MULTISPECIES: TonB-dependent receptor [unclassified Chryseobacterium]OBW40880.1 Catecholate siderophore receptor Fiu precursor [Chryseobacterium sp. MOF25P]OBW45344.1 Catecholate siderophore receptor Fiu precursor [Chryseobacterium sp. BGARF1]